MGGDEVVIVIVIVIVVVMFREELRCDHGVETGALVPPSHKRDKAEEREETLHDEQECPHGN